MYRIGIAGGTFDPIHNGHIAYAEYVCRTFDLDQVLFIPSGEPPHKAGRRVTPGTHRLNMVRLAIAGRPKMACSDMEICRPGRSYTVDTLRALREQYGTDGTFYYIIGADVPGELTKWKQAEAVFRLCAFIATVRPGYDRTAFEAACKEAAAAGAVIHVVDGPQVDISSTEIRDLIRCGREAASLLPPPVADYIAEHGLYRGETEKLSFSEIYADLKQQLSPKRFLHSVGVMEECIRLAHLFGADEETCRIAGILHDCAKELDPEQLVWMDAADLTPSGDCYDGACENTVHGKAGAYLAKERYGIEDPEILEAIRCHVTGQPEMGLVAQIVFVADYTEPGRLGPHFDYVRQQLKKGLREGMLAECDMVIRHVLEKDKKPLCIDTVRTRNWIVRSMGLE